MCEANPRGPEVDGNEDLYRGITTPAWWVESEGRPSSAAFTSERKFSVNVVSLTTVDDTLKLLKPKSGLIEFNCGVARELNFNAHLERDPDHPDNEAHAHIYCDIPTSKRKRCARKLVAKSRVICEPTFDRC